MRAKLIFSAVVVGLVGCASSTPESASNPPAPETKTADPSEDSQILSTKKCPKHSKLVDGTCVLQVESDD